METFSSHPDDVFRASTQIEYNNAAKAKLEALILSLEDELSKLREITQDGGKLGVSDSSWFGLTKGSAIHQRAKYLLAQMDEAMGKLQAADASNTLQKKVFADTAK